MQVSEDRVKYVVRENCQSASKIDPLSARNIDPPHARKVAGPRRRSFQIAQTARACGFPGSSPCFEPPAFIAGLDDFAVMSEPVE